jgi:pilus assembly protein Flp/PilA
MMNNAIRATRKFLGLKPREEGATMVEYGLMVALIAVVCLVAVTALGVNIQGIFNQIGAAV